MLELCWSMKGMQVNIVLVKLHISKEKTLACYKESGNSDFNYHHAKPN